MAPFAFSQDFPEQSKTVWGKDGAVELSTQSSEKKKIFSILKDSARGNKKLTLKKNTEGKLKFKVRHMNAILHRCNLVPPISNRQICIST